MIIFNNLIIIFTFYITHYTINYISLQLLILNTLIACYSSYKYDITYTLYLNILIIIIGLSFIIENIFLFYICFELLLLPIFYTILFYGQSEDNTYISYKFIYYTLTCSLFWLSFLIYSLNYIYNTYISITLSFLFLISLLVKLPLPPLHLWLNDTHTSSPVSSSILLAGTVLKLSIYGFIIFYITYFYYNLPYINTLLIILLIFGIIYTSLASIRQSDYKRFIAYTSIGHMNLAMISILPLSYIGIYGSYLLLIAHAFISGSLFYHVNSIYEKYHTKIIIYLKGLSIILPISSCFAILFNIFNFSMPPALTWFSEYFILSNFIHSYLFTTFIISFISIISLLYTMWNYFRIYFSDILPYFTFSSDNSFITILIQLYFILLTLILILFISDL